VSIRHGGPDTVVAAHWSLGAWWRCERRRRAVTVGLLVLLAIAVRSVGLKAPYLDYHCHRQTDTASIARNFYEKDPDIFLPQVNRRADAPNYVEAEFQLIPWLAAAAYRVVGEVPWVGRGLVVLFGGLAVLAAFGWVAVSCGYLPGLFAGLFLALCPMAIYFGRTFMPDTPALACAFLGLWWVAIGLREGSRRFLAVGLGAVALGLLLKITVLFVYAPLTVLLWRRTRRSSHRARWMVLLVGSLPLLPAAAWYAWAYELGKRYLTFGIWDRGYSKWGSADLVLRWSFVELMVRRTAEEILTPVGIAMGEAGAVRSGRRRRAAQLVLLRGHPAILRPGGLDPGRGGGSEGAGRSERAGPHRRLRQQPHAALPHASTRLGFLE
jgi:hypothetical protein